MKVLFYSSINIDTTFHLDHIVKEGETESSSSVTIGAGGKGSNQSAAFAKALDKNTDIKVYFAGKCSKDGDFIVEKLRNLGINTDYIFPSSCGTGQAIIQVDRQGKNSIVLYGGGNQAIEKSEIDKTLESFSAGDVLFINCEINNLSYIVDSAFKKGMKIILNPSPVNQALYSIDMNKISSLILNEIEAIALCGSDNIEKVCEKYPDCEIVLTLGSKGSMYGYKNERYICPACKVKAVDTTGAGDTYMGFYYAQRLCGNKVEDALSIAAKASAIAVSRPGAMDSIPFIEEIKNI